MILIDALRRNPDELLQEKRLPLSMRRTCHMTSTDSLQELLEFGREIGMRREWLHGAHFDLNPQKRALALKMGAEEAGSTRLACQNWRRQQQRREKGAPQVCFCDHCPPDVERTVSVQGRTKQNQSRQLVLQEV